MLWICFFSFRSADTLARSTKEPLRTESVIKTVTDKQDALKKQSDVDKRSSAETQGSSVPLRYPDRGKGSEVRNSDDGRTKGPPSRDMSLRDAPGSEDVPRRDKQSIATEYDRTRDKISKAKGFEHLAVDSNGNKKPTNGLASARLVENAPVSSSSYEKGYTSEALRLIPQTNRPLLFRIITLCLRKHPQIRHIQISHRPCRNSHLLRHA